MWSPTAMGAITEQYYLALILFRSLRLDLMYTDDRPETKEPDREAL